MPPQVEEPEENGVAGSPSDELWPTPEDSARATDANSDDEQTPLGHDELVALRSSRHVARRPRRRRRWPWVAVLVALILGAASFAAYTYGWPLLQDFLISRNVSSAAAGYPALVTSFEDGVAIVSGDIGTTADADAVISSIQRVDGVERVDASLNIAVEATDSLEDAIIQALAGVGITSVTPLVEGSMVTLIGSVPDADSIDLASTVAVAVDGVSQVLNRVIIAADAAEAAQQILIAAGYPSVVVVIDGNVAVLSGTVAGEGDALAVAGVALELPGIEKVDNRVTVGITEETVPADGPIGSPDALVSAALIAAGYDTVSVTFDGSTAYLDGVVPFETLEGGYFAFVDGVRSIVVAEGNPEVTVNRLRLRGNETELRAELTELLDASPIVFLSGSSDLTAESQAALVEAAEIILSQPGLQIFIAGHTDASGSAADNEQLARERGEVVFGSLVALGVPANRMAVVSYGELFPGEGATAAEDRRIEFEVGP
jgi:osmotically-inducible protein OsmY